MSLLSCPVSASDTRLTSTHLLPFFLSPSLAKYKSDSDQRATGLQLFLLLHAACVQGSSAAASVHIMAISWLKQKKRYSVHLMLVYHCCRCRWPHAMPAWVRFTWTPWATRALIVQLPNLPCLTSTTPPTYFYTLHGQIFGRMLQTWRDGAYNHIRNDSETPWLGSNLKSKTKEAWNFKHEWSFCTSASLYIHMKFFWELLQY